MNDRNEKQKAASTKSKPLEFVQVLEMGNEVTVLTVFDVLGERRKWHKLSISMFNSSFRIRTFEYAPHSFKLTFRRRQEMVPLW